MNTQSIKHSNRPGSSTSKAQSFRFTGAEPTDLPQTESSSQTSVSSSVEGIADEAFAAGRDFKAKAADLAGSSADAMKNQASEFVDVAKDAASQAGDRIQQEVNNQKNAGADYIGSLAEAMRRAAGEFESDVPIAATYIRKAASHVDTVSDTIQSGNLNDLLRGVQSFARRKPAVFLGLAALAGFGVIRFLKSSASSSKDHELSPTSAPGQYASTSQAREYRDEFTK